VSVPKVRVDVFVHTSPGNPLSKLLADVSQFLSRLGENSGGFGALIDQLLDGLLALAQISLAGLELLFIDASNFLAGLVSGFGPGNAIAASGAGTASVSALLLMPPPGRGSGASPDNAASGVGSVRASARGRMLFFGGGSGAGLDTTVSGARTVMAQGQMPPFEGGSGAGLDNVASGGGVRVSATARASTQEPMPVFGGGSGAGQDNAASGGGAPKGSAQGQTSIFRGGQAAGLNTAVSGSGAARASARLQMPFFGGGSGGGRNVDNADPVPKKGPVSKKKKAEDSSDDGFLPEGGDPLPSILPDVGVTEESRPPVAPPEPEGRTSDGASQLSSGPEQRGSEVGLLILQVTVALIGGQSEQRRAVRASVVTTERSGQRH
jgi:hypothetical protein